MAIENQASLAGTLQINASNITETVGENIARSAMIPYSRVAIGASEIRSRQRSRRICLLGQPAAANQRRTGNRL